MKIDEGLFKTLFWLVYAIGKDDFSTLPLCFKKDVSETSFNVLFFAVKKNLLEVLKWTNENWAFPEINCTTLVKGIILKLTTPPPGIFKCFALQILANLEFKLLLLSLHFEFQIDINRGGGLHILFWKNPDYKNHTDLRHITFFCWFG